MQRVFKYEKEKVELPASDFTVSVLPMGMITSLGGSFHPFGVTVSINFACAEIVREWVQHGLIRLYRVKQDEPLQLLVEWPLFLIPPFFNFRVCMALVNIELLNSGDVLIAQFDSSVLQSDFPRPKSDEIFLNVHRRRC